MTISKTVVFDAWHRIDSGAYLFRQINRLTVRMTYLLSTLTLSLVCAADYFTGIELMMSPMYAFPCLLMDWRIGRLQALLYALGASYVQWLVGTFGGRTYTHASYLYWDIVLNIIFYGALIWVVSKLRLALEIERILSRVDFLTRLANRDSFCDVLKREIRRSRRYGHSLTLVTVDCDKLNHFNEKRGHSTGDLLLQAVADALQKKFRDTDLVSRFADDEFMVLLPETDASAASTVLTSVRTQLNSLMQLRGWPVTFSCACTVFTCPLNDVNAVLERQAQTLQMAKRLGDGKLAQRVWEAEDVPTNSSTFGTMSQWDSQ